VLAHIQRRKMKAENFGGAAQIFDTSTRQTQRAMLE
jgi:hypothetical protein